MTAPVESQIDPVGRRVVVTTEFNQPPEVVWRLWSEPARLARWWGPPGRAMTVDEHDLRPGGKVVVTVATPDRPIRGRWKIHDVEPPHRLTFTFESDGIDPTTIEVDMLPSGPGATTMQISVRFASDDAFQHARSIGFDAGLRRSIAHAHNVIHHPMGHTDSV